MPPATRYVLIGAALVLLALLAQFALHTYRTDPRDARTIAERELQLNTLASGEHVIRMVSVFQRPWLDYFRATRGLLVLTDRRLLYLGLQPRDLLSTGDSPPTFEERGFPIDTLTRLSPGRTFFGIAKAIVVTTPRGSVTLGVPAEAWPRARLLIAGMEGRYERLHSRGVALRARREQLEKERTAAEAEARKPRTYVVRRGDAVASVAAAWNTTPDRLRQWNNLPDNRIRIGQTLVVKPQS